MSPVRSSYSRWRRPRHRSRGSGRGQSLVEFTLVFPFFLILLFAVIEFAFALNALLSIDYASRQAALAAAEGGNQLGADCSILRTVEESVQTPADASRISNVVIFKANANGTPLGPQVVYNRSDGASKPCPLPDGTPDSLPYSFAGGSYTEQTRCNVLAGCGSRTVDTIGVEMTYLYRWHTPLPSLWPTGGTGYTMTKGNSMRMEPVL
jgi:TadE-like protein